MSDFAQSIRNSWSGLSGVADAIIIVMLLIVVLIVLLSIFSAVVSLILTISYIKYNRRTNSFNMTGEQIARRNLDNNGLEDIKVSKNGSILFGNSYSHFFKKVRLRRLIWKRRSITSMAMAYQKSELAVLDSEGDGAMKTRNVLTPIIYFGPLAFVPLVIIGALLDLFIFKSSGGYATIILSCLGLCIYVVSFLMSLMVLKTEIKAQRRALESMEEDGADEDEIEDCRRLYRLYNIQYVNDMIVALLELIYRVLQIASYFQGNSSNSSRNNRRA